jgi:hypothetical protein
VERVPQERRTRGKDVPTETAAERRAAWRTWGSVARAGPAQQAGLSRSRRRRGRSRRA